MLREGSEATIYYAWRIFQEVISERELTLSKVKKRKMVPSERTSYTDQRAQSVGKQCKRQCFTLATALGSVENKGRLD